MVLYAELPYKIYCQISAMPDAAVKPMIINSLPAASTIISSSVYENLNFSKYAIGFNGVVIQISGLKK